MKQGIVSYWLAIAGGWAVLTYSCSAADDPCDLSLPAMEQAKCLLRNVKQYGHLGPEVTNLPAALESRVGRPIDVTKEGLTAYLKKNQIAEERIGGPLTGPVSKTRKGESALYFIIHDTSSPVFGSREDFPTNINDFAWSGNDLDRILKGSTKKAHVFINRTGDSVTVVDFKAAHRSTKYELASRDRRGLFLGVELTQPRRRDAKGIDAFAPEPGFTDSQLDRLALVYIAASVRRGQWLIPTFHAALDAGIKNAHDDPQNFNLERWAERLQRTIESIKSGT